MQTLPPDGGVAVPLYATVQQQRGGSLVGDVANVRAALLHDGRDTGSIATTSNLQVALNYCYGYHDSHSAALKLNNVSPEQDFPSDRCTANLS